MRAQSVARWEQGTSTPLARYRRPLAESLELTLPQLEALIESGETPSGLNGHALPPWMDHYTSLEQGAAILRTFEPIAVPGLLQTEAYAMAVMAATHLPVDGQAIADRVRVRMARQAVLDRRPEPLELICVVDESVLHRITGSRSVMADQLGHLTAMASRPTIRLQIVSRDSSVLHSAAFGSFRLFTSSGATEPFMACTEDLTGFNYLDRRHAIEAHAELFDHLTSVALSPGDSVELIGTTALAYR